MIASRYQKEVKELKDANAKLKAPVVVPRKQRQTQKYVSKLF